MSYRKSAQFGALAVLLMLVLASCGQHAGVHAAGGLAPGTIDVNDPGTDPGTNPGTDPGTDPGTNPGTDPGADPGTNPGTDPGTDPGTNPGPIVGDRTGITATTITIGLHAPLTGAAPIQPLAFEKGKDLYWRWLHEVKKQKIFGREVKVVFRDDQYTPTTAVAVCNQMATSDRAFMLIGGAGTDQINACAGYAEGRKIPYLSPGVQEAGLSKRKTYFAVTMSYAQQMPLLLQLLKKVDAKKSLDVYGGIGGGDGKILFGHVRPNTPNFNDAATALKKAVLAAGWQYKEYTVVKEGSSTEAQTVATQAQQDGVDIIMPITAPTFTVQLGLQADKNGYKPKWAGVGITNNLNAFVNTVCGKSPNPTSSTVQGAIFLSPWAGWKQVQQGQYDPDYAQAAKRFAADVNTRDKNGDLVLAFWGIMKGIHQALLAAGPNVTRESFVSTMSRFSYASQLFPTLRFTPGSPFGAQNVHVLRGSCAEPADAAHDVQAGAQFIEDPDYPGLHSSF